MDDAIRAEILKESDLPEIVRQRIGNSHSSRINAIVTDLVENSAAGEIGMSEEMTEAVDCFRDFLFEAVYRNPRAKSEESKVKNILGGIWEHYVNNPDKLPEDYLRIADMEGVERAVCDYVSGMTDDYAIYQFGNIFVPAAWELR